VTRTLLARLVPALLGVAYLALCAWIDMGGFDPIAIDSHSYMECARGLLETGNLARPTPSGQYELDFQRTPGYPVAIAGLQQIAGLSTPVVLV